jgi:hypothetical protein
MLLSRAQTIHFPLKIVSGAHTSRRFPIFCSVDFRREILKSAASLASIGCILVFHLCMEYVYTVYI